VSADVLARAEQGAVGAEESRGVQRAGRAKQRLLRAQALGQREQDPSFDPRHIRV